MTKKRFNMHMDEDLKAWLQAEAKRTKLKTATNYVQYLLEAARDGRIAVIPQEPHAFPGSYPTPGSSPTNPALIACGPSEEE